MTRRWRRGRTRWASAEYVTEFTNRRTKSQATLDTVFRALADPTRRAVLEHLCDGPAAVGELSRLFKMALPSFMQHLHVLEDCKLVRSEKSGRVRTYRLTPQRLKIAENWITDQRTLWERRLDQLDAYLIKLKEKKK